MIGILLVLALTAAVVVGFVFYTLKNLLLVSSPSEALILSGGTHAIEGKTVGYRSIRGGRAVRIEVVTEGILVRRIQGDPSLEGTGLVVLDEVVNNALELVRDRATAKGLALQVDMAPDLPPCCISDPLHMGQVLLNILSNAVKFTEAGSVTLSLSCQEGMLVFRVTDTGIGMDAAQIELLFNPFQQGDASATRKFGGSGLGLHIVYNLVTQTLHGKIQCISKPGEGTLARVRLPLPDAPA
mgnify:CR=1 FL=1